MGIGDVFGPGGGSGEVDSKTEDISSQVNGSQNTFILIESYDSKSLKIYYNGLRQSQSSITEIAPRSFRLDFTPENGTSLIVDYNY